MGLLQRTIEELSRPAILLGNGINRLQNTLPDWKTLLKELGAENLNFEGLTYNEIYDFIQINHGNDKALKKKIAQFLIPSEFDSLIPHSSFLDIAMNYRCPVLTTNFDLTLESTKELKFYRTQKKGFTRYYPWDKYSAEIQIESPTEGFGLWHIHGVSLHPDSIRLGLTDYMGSVEKARKLIHRGDSAIFRGKDRANWTGKNTWLHIWFNMPIIIVGIQLESQEVFIRWLLIERERYFRRFENRRKGTIFLSTGNDTNINNFLQNLNIQHKITSSIEDYSSLYL
ncbi:SIR2 family protein [Maribacter stanieri]|uniref:SIR2 family protein n=1 Tax=Maribacter stanieri TaxID=440514 RepID=UPI0024941428|nr:hypothetical protein [Maribacter stanieri]